VSDPVKRSDWRVSPLPTEHWRLPLELSFTASEFAKIQQVRMPRESGDTWFIFFEDPWHTLQVLVIARISTVHQDIESGLSPCGMPAAKSGRSPVNCV
jgi:hypothetical protein